MIGAMIGDIAGSRFEVRNHRSKDFRLFDRHCRPTDDSIMSLAVAKAILECGGDYRDLSAKAVSCMQELGRIYKNAGYGGSFKRWLQEENPQPYGSFGNGAAMRVGPCGFAAESIDEAKQLSEKVTRVSHNHPEGLKGAEAIAVSVFLARTGKKKYEIRKYVSDYYYDIHFSIDQIRPSYRFDVSCQGSVPVALEAFFEAKDFEDAVRNAISVGGDSDTIAAMAGAVAEAYYGVPEEMIFSTMDYLDAREAEILYDFEKKYPSKAMAEGRRNKNANLRVFDVIDDCVDKTIAAGAKIYTGAAPPEPEGYVGFRVFDAEGLTEEAGGKEGGPVHAWVKKSDMVPDFSSFDQKRRHE